MSISILSNTGRLKSGRARRGEGGRGGDGSRGAETLAGTCTIATGHDSMSKVAIAIRNCLVFMLSK